MTVEFNERCAQSYLLYVDKPSAPGFSQLSGLVTLQAMGNVVLRHKAVEIQPGDGGANDSAFLRMSNGTTDVVLGILAIAMAEEAKTDTQRHLAAWIARRDQSILGIGRVGFALSEMPWTPESLDEDRSFFIRSCQRSMSKRDWARSGYTPRQNMALDSFEALATMAGNLIPTELESASNDWGDEEVQTFTRCIEHSTFLHEDGCIICNSRRSTGSPKSTSDSLASVPDTTMTARAEYGKESPLENSKEIIDPDRNDIESLLELISTGEAFMSISPSHEPNAIPTIMTQRIKEPDSEPWWDILRMDSQENMFRLDTLSRTLVADVLTEWCQSGRRHELDFGGYEWAKTEHISYLGGFEDEDEDEDDYEDQPREPMPNPFDTIEFRGLLEEAIRSSWNLLTTKHADEGIYGFGLDSNGAQYFLPTAFTEAGFASLPQEPNFAGVRWSSADSPHHLIGMDAFDALNKYFYENYDAFNESYEAFSDHNDIDLDFVARCAYDVGFDMLRKLRDGGLFDSVPDVVLNIWIMEHGAQHEDNAHRANPPEVAEMFIRTMYD